MRRVMLIQGAQESSFFPREKFNSDSGAIALVSEAQAFLRGVEVNGRPLLLYEYCAAKDKAEFSARYQIVAEHLLLFVWSHLLWTRLPANLRQEQEETALLGQSYGLWIAAFLGGLCEFPTAVRLITQRLLLCSAVSGDSILVRKHEGTIDFAYLEILCRKHGNVWLSAINHQRQCVISGMPEGIETILQTIRDIKGYERTRKINIGPPWHTPSLSLVAEKIEKAFRSFHELSDLTIPILCLNNDEKLMRIWKKEEVFSHMLGEITQRRNFLEIVRQLPGDVELVELPVHKNLFLTSTIHIIREEQH